ncbi:MAG: PQQ-like beta-propeller repeat protein, partial [Verrucomicrobiae bacterium]|nr:PQQ-like beta-propeller repeat protein [Verrucomicrobiae bacterium]
MGPNRNGVASESLPAEFDLETIAWRASVGVGFASVAVSDGRVYAVGHDGKKQDGEETLWCLDAKTGEIIWSARTPAELLPNLHEGGPAATPAVEGKVVFSLSKDGLAACRETASGALIWNRNLMAEAGMTKPPEWGFAGSPVIQGDLVIFEAGATFALDKTTGTVVWKSQPFRPAYGSPAPFAGEGGRPRLAVLKTDGLVLLDGESGGTVAFERWETPFDTNATTPILHGHSLFVSTGYDRGCALFQFDGRQLSKRYEGLQMCNHMNQSILIDGHLYGFDGTAHRG